MFFLANAKPHLMLMTSMLLIFWHGKNQLFLCLNGGFKMKEVFSFIFSLIMIFGLGYLGGWCFNKIRMPKLIWYIILGILLGPSLFNIVDANLLKISSILRKIALVIILTRSGLSLDIKTLKKIGRPAIMMCMVPAVFEMVGITIFAPLIFKIDYLEAMLMGSVLAAVSPAVVVPRMLKLMDEKYGTKHNVAELVLAGSSCDDIFVIVLFTAFEGLVKSNEQGGSINLGLTFLQIPSSIILGILLGALLGFLMVQLYKRYNVNKWIKFLLTAVASAGMILIEEYSLGYFSGLLGIIAMGIVILSLHESSAKEIKPTYNELWKVFEVLLFVLVGCATDAKLAFGMDGLKLIGLISISLIFRSLGVIICVMKTKYTLKERIYIIMSYLPKATVQASIGAIALQDGLSCGMLILTAAVVSILFTAPIGAILMDTLYKKLLTKDEETKDETIEEKELAPQKN